MRLEKQQFIGRFTVQSGRRVSARRLGVLVAALLAMGVVPPTAAADPIQYVALGDSSAAGPGIPTQSVDGCMRSDRNWPRVLSGILGADLKDVTCTGATTANLNGSQSFPTAPSIPAVRPQFEALNDDTRLVTLAIGANDINLAQAMVDCWTLPGVPIRKSCAEQHLKDGKDTLTGAIQALGPKVGAALDQIKEKSTQARVFVVGYLTYWQSGGCPSTDIYTSVDADYLQGKFDELHDMLAAQAKAHGATYVDIRTPSTTHGVCASTADRWLVGWDGVGALAYHPNATGMENAARIIADSIN